MQLRCFYYSLKFIQILLTTFLRCNLALVAGQSLSVPNGTRKWEFQKANGPQALYFKGFSTLRRHMQIVNSRIFSVCFFCFSVIVVVIVSAVEHASENECAVTEAIFFECGISLSFTGQFWHFCQFVKYIHGATSKRTNAPKKKQQNITKFCAPTSSPIRRNRGICTAGIERMLCRMAPTASSLLIHSDEQMCSNHIVWTQNLTKHQQQARKSIHRLS